MGNHNRPLAIIVEVTSRCNLQCVMCGTPHMTRRKADMELSLFKKIVDECASAGHLLLWLHHMGEPLLYPHLAEAIEYQVRVCGYPPCISTNGMLLDKEMCEKLKDAGAHTIMVCISSMRRSVYDKLRIGGDLDRVVKNTHTAYDVGFDIIIQKMDTIYNHDETNGEYYEEFGGAAGRPRLRIESWPVNKFKPGGLYVGYNESLEPTCHLLASHFVICQDGRVAICCFDYDCTTPCGDVNTDTISHIAEYGFDHYVEKIRARDTVSMPACKECLSMEWRNELPTERFVPAWGSCIE